MWRTFCQICQFHLRNIQQRKFRLPPFEQHGVPFTLVVAESNILAVNVPVARFQFSDQHAFGVSVAAQNFRRTDIVGECAKQGRIRPELPEHGDELPQVFAQERVRLRLRHGACRIPFALLQPMTPAYIGIMFFRVPALKIFRASHRPLERRQAVDCRLSVRSLLAADLCGHRTDRHKRTEHHHEYTHHLDKGLMSPTPITVWSSFTFRLLKSNSNS